ncbi:hypothetical protein AVEN_196355-1 [Araneus ventricosus]|uniref:Uncharacterized protein n=1 Tax=Araneus ventricosus TaxID=182803 RepID=A0A4Y2AUW0_ARAVE|nr:hypothetical protein AVEN_196355-1 [Araneus ventricosus]
MDWFDLDTLTFRFEATRGLFWDEPRNFEPRSYNEPELASPLQTSKPHQREGVRPCNTPHTPRIFGGIGFRSWNPPAPKPRPYH